MFITESSDLGIKLEAHEMSAGIDSISRMRGGAGRGRRYRSI
jgi:hypothetical protein